MNKKNSYEYYSSEELASNLVILLYHGVTDTISKGIENFSKKHISAHEFERHMMFIKNNCNVLTIDDIVEIHKNNEKWPKNSVVVTFDDGFKNNYTTAVPILKKLNVPATFYVCSGMIETNKMFWVDIIEDCINLTKVKKIRILLEKNTDFELDSNDKKIFAVTEIKKFCKIVDVYTKNRVINSLKNVTKTEPKPSNAKNYKMLSWDELNSINEDPLFTIGGHTLYHDIMSAHDDEKRMFKDVELSIDLLEFNLNEKIIHYSYPEGQKNHYNHNVINKLKESNIVCSPSAIHGINPSYTDVFNLFRIMPGFMGTPFPYD
jgi:peptidoglycan/xylan/chitin deacetylase (PgdA/CDA1 family)